MRTLKNLLVVVSILFSVAHAQDTRTSAPSTPDEDTTIIFKVTLPPPTNPTSK